MPARSNEFQRLILLLERELAPRGARVIESSILKDLVDGKEREIDIALEIPIGARAVRIAIECRDHKRPATVVWINELSGKYLHLPVDRVIAVSRSGFTKAARSKAAVSKIDLLTFEEAVDFDWKTVSPKGRAVVLATIRYRCVKIELSPPLPQGEARAIADPIFALKIYREPTRVIYLGELIHNDLTRDPMRSIMQRTWHEDSSKPIILTLLMPGWFYVDAFGTEHAIHNAKITIEGGIDWLKFWLKPGKYAGTNVAFAEVIIDGQPVSLAITQREGDEPEWNWYLKDSEKYPWRNLETLFEFTQEAKDALKLAGENTRHE